MADNLTTFMCRLSLNLGASISWNPQGLSMHVIILLYLYKGQFPGSMVKYNIIFLRERNFFIKKIVLQNTFSCLVKNSPLFSFQSLITGVTVSTVR
jgi:hypothetical protein